MHLPRYWAKSQFGSSGVYSFPPAFACWRWSDVSQDEAQRRADAGARERAQIFEAGESLDRYAYTDQPLREEILEVVSGDGERGASIISRNGYGVLVLNAASAMFIDIDIPVLRTRAKAANLIRRWIGAAPAVEESEEAVLRKIRAWAHQHVDLGLRVYRTFAGFRCLVTNRTFNAADPQSTQLLESIGSDPLYVRLCKSQQSFRARLSPKPWRCGTHVPPSRYPWQDAPAEAAFRVWQRDYERRSRGYAVCRLVEQLNSGKLDPALAHILKLHDRLACGQTGQSLA